MIELQDSIPLEFTAVFIGTVVEFLIFKCLWLVNLTYIVLSLDIADKVVYRFMFFN